MPLSPPLLSRMGQSHIVTSSDPLRFGRRATKAEMEQIEKAARVWSKEPTLNPRLCFVRSESKIPVWNSIQKAWNWLMDGLSIRMYFFKNKFGRWHGLFPRATDIPEVTDIYILRKFKNPEQAKAQFDVLEKDQKKSIALKQAMAEVADILRRRRVSIGKDLLDLDTRSFGLPNGWWSKALKAHFPSQVQEDQSNGPEVYMPTCRVTRHGLDDASVLTRTRLGPHQVLAKKRRDSNRTGTPRTTQKNTVI